MTLWKYVKLWAPKAPQIFLFSFLLPPPKAAENGRRWRSKRGAEDAVPPEDERTPAEGSYFASNYLI